jgi:hypothetical protein
MGLVNLCAHAAMPEKLDFWTVFVIRRRRSSCSPEAVWHWPDADHVSRAAEEFKIAVGTVRSTPERKLICPA